MQRAVEGSIPKEGDFCGFAVSFFVQEIHRFRALNQEKRIDSFVLNIHPFELSKTCGLYTPIAKRLNLKIHGPPDPVFFAKARGTPGGSLGLSLGQPVEG
jgi:hypothetical protein